MTKAPGRGSRIRRNRMVSVPPVVANSICTRKFEAPRSALGDNLEGACRPPRCETSNFHRTVGERIKHPAEAKPSPCRFPWWRKTGQKSCEGRLPNTGAVSVTRRDHVVVRTLDAVTPCSHDRLTEFVDGENVRVRRRGWHRGSDGVD